MVYDDACSETLLVAFCWMIVAETLLLMVDGEDLLVLLMMLVKLEFYSLASLCRLCYLVVQFGSLAGFIVLQ